MALHHNHDAAEGKPSALKLDDDVFGLGVLLQGHNTFFTANARLLIAAKRVFNAAFEIIIDVNLTGLKFACYAVRARYIARPKPRRQTVIRVIGNGDGFFFLPAERDTAQRDTSDLSGWSRRRGVRSRPLLCRSVGSREEWRSSVSFFSFALFIFCFKLFLS